MRQMLLTCQCRDRRLLRHITSDRTSLWLERCRSSLFGIAAMAAFLGASVGEASASGVTVLPNAVSYEYFGLNFAINIATSSSVGTLNYTGDPGCGALAQQPHRSDRFHPSPSRSMRSHSKIPAEVTQKPSWD